MLAALKVYEFCYVYKEKQVCALDSPRLSMELFKKSNSNRKNVFLGDEIVKSH